MSETLWPNQTLALREVPAAIDRGDKRILLTSPTGTGKARIACLLIDRWVEEGKRVSLYTNRKMLIEQLSGVLDKHGIRHGVRAAGHDDELHLDVQVSSVQTEGARVIKRATWELHPAERVLIDECHINVGRVSQELMRRHLEQGAAIVGLTATPIGLGDLYDTLIVAGNNSEMMKCGALVSCDHYAPDEPDLKHCGRIAIGEDLTEKQNVKAIMLPGVYGRVYTNWRRFNPDAKPTILFGPGVGEALGFAEHFQSKGVPSAHIDGEEIWIRGHSYRADKEARKDLLEQFKAGEIKLLTNRFVLREGIDIPSVECMIFATVFGSLQSYLQAGGRGLRASPSTGKTKLTLLDHGGCWHRLGSLNADREWCLNCTNAIITGLREDTLRKKRCKQCKAPLGQGRLCPRCGVSNEVEPFQCPECRRVLTTLRCPCGFEIQPGKKSRPVIQADGTLKEMAGDIYKPRRVCHKANAAKLWEQMYWRARSKKWNATFRQAEVMFAKENGWAYPPRDIPFMPTTATDFFLKVSEVPLSRLIPKQAVEELK